LIKIPKSLNVLNFFLSTQISPSLLRLFIGDERKKFFPTLTTGGVQRGAGGKHCQTGMFLFQVSPTHIYRKTKNRLLKVCYVPATSARLSRLLFLCGC
jgi:hypothetical protein